MHVGICMYVSYTIVTSKQSCMYTDRPAAVEIEEKKEVEKTPFEYVAATINATGVYIHTYIHTVHKFLYIFIALAFSMHHALIQSYIEYHRIYCIIHTYIHTHTNSSETNLQTHSGLGRTGGLPAHSNEKNLCGEMGRGAVLRKGYTC